ILGPLTNPAQPAASAIGVASATLAPVMAGVIAAQGREALVFRNRDGLDEMAATAAADLWEVRDGAVVESSLDPVADLGLKAVTIDDLRGGEPAENAEIARRVFAGERGAVHDTVALNAAAGLVADGTLAGTGEGSLAERFAAAFSHASTALVDGEAEQVVERWAAATQR